jgi:outer membrane protein OmpA-like peptidoglycan-associated protein
MRTSPARVQNLLGVLLSLVFALACSRDAAPRHDLDPPRVASSADERGTGEEGDVSEDSVIIGRACPERADDSATAADITAQAAAIIPLVEGLTLADIWVGPDSGVNNFDNECLQQVTRVERGRVVLMNSCNDRPGVSSVRHRVQLCRGDLSTGHIYRTIFGSANPDLVAGSTLSVLSRRAFRELRDRGETKFRHIELHASSWIENAEAADPEANIYVQNDLSGTLRRTGFDTVNVLVNDAQARIPVVRAEVILRGKRSGFDEHQRMVIVNDERVPLVLELWRTTTNTSIRFIRISYPRQSEMTRALERERKTVVYGLYFDYNSARLRTESEPILREIAATLAENADWRLSIEGHTDSIGGATFNRDLSLRRAESVRAALVERHGIAASRLDVAGAGASAPLDSNTTVTGRARNRRVELRRQ